MGSDHCPIQLQLDLSGASKEEVKVSGQKSKIHAEESEEEYCEEEEEEMGESKPSASKRSSNIKQPAKKAMRKM